MRFKFFLCASADFGVRRSKVSSSRCSSAYINFSRVTQAAWRPLVCPSGLGDQLEVQLDGCLHQARIAGALDAAEIAAIGDVAIRVEEPGVVGKVENVPTKFYSHPLVDGGALLNR